LKPGSLAEWLGSGELGREIAAFILECQDGLRRGTLGGKAAAKPQSPLANRNPTEPNPIKTDQTE